MSQIQCRGFQIFFLQMHQRQRLHIVTLMGVQCVGPLCYDFSRLDAYISQAHVRKELGVGDRKWEACNMEVNFDMQGTSARLPLQIPFALPMALPHRTGFGVACNAGPFSCVGLATILYITLDGIRGGKLREEIWKSAIKTCIE